MTVSLERLLAQIIEDLAIAHPEDRAAYERVAVEPQLMPILNDPRHQEVWVVAKFEDQALFYDDVEGGFNVSPVVDGNLIEAGYSQDPLGGAIHTWHELRERA